LQMPAFGELKEHVPNSVRGGELKVLFVCGVV
jgi:hypothetical protein